MSFDFSPKMSKISSFVSLKSLIYRVFKISMLFALLEFEKKKLPSKYLEVKNSDLSILFDSFDSTLL